MATTKTLAEALSAIQAEAPTLQKSKVNPHFGSRFVPLNELHEAVLPIVNKHGCVWIALPCRAGDEPALRYQILHVATGQSEGDVMPLVLAKRDPQGQGSAITYARRYALMAVLGLVADEDDDGNAGSDGNLPERQIDDTPKTDQPRQPRGGQRLASEKQVKLVRYRASEAGIDDPSLQILLESVAGVESADAIPQRLVDTVLDAIKKASE